MRRIMCWPTSGGAWLRARMRRLPPLPWQTRRGFLATVAVGAVASVGLAGWAWQMGWPQQAATGIHNQVAEITAQADFVVGEVFVFGRKNTKRDDLVQAIEVRRGDPILFVNLEGLRSRVMELSWVADASVERKLPSIIILRIKERTPVALWQNEQRFAVIDAMGNVLTRHDLTRFSHLPRIVGEKAPGPVADYISMIASEPELTPLVEAGGRISGRRWTIYLRPDTEVWLPEEGASEAWARLAAYQRVHRILEKNAKIIDLRVPGRVTLRPADPIEEPHEAKEAALVDAMSRVSTPRDRNGEI